MRWNCSIMETIINQLHIYEGFPSQKKSDTNLTRKPYRRNIQTITSLKDSFNTFAGIRDYRVINLCAEFQSIYIYRKTPTLHILQHRCDVHSFHRKLFLYIRIRNTHTHTNTYTVWPKFCNRFNKHTASVSLNTKSMNRAHNINCCTTRK